jgi:hypothetical protein
MFTEETEDFFSAFWQFSEAALSAVDVSQKIFCLGRRSLSVKIPKRHSEKMFHSLSHLQHEILPDIDFNLLVWDSETTGRQLPSIPWAHGEPPEKGEIISLRNNRFQSNYNLDSMTFSVIDRLERRAVYWRRQMNQIPCQEQAAPLRFILNSWFKSKNVFLIHAAAVAESGKGILLSGKGGSGKSTTALQCLLSGMDYLGDDYVLVDAENPHNVHSIYNAAKMASWTLERYPEVKESIPNPEELWEEKALVFLEDVHPERLVKSARVQALVIPKVTEGEPVIRPIGKAEALLAAGPSTIFQQWGSDEGLFSFLARLVRDLPVFRLETGSDPTKLPDLIGSLIGESHGR